jgi:hypothetical protein
MPRKRPLTGLLLKPFRIDDVPARGLRLALGAPPDASDLEAYLRGELDARWAELDKYFGLSSERSDLFEMRAKALIGYCFGIRSDDPRWWERLAWAMVTRHIPGFSSSRSGRKKRGAPIKWPLQRQAELFADVEYLKRKTGKSGSAICKTLPRRRGYTKRWDAYGAEALRKAYTNAKGNQDLLFRLELFGPEILMKDKQIDPIDAAIKRHALRV